MKRDIELLRRILLEVEDFEPGTSGYVVTFPDEYTDSLVNAFGRALHSKRQRNELVSHH